MILSCWRTVFIAAPALAFATSAASQVSNLENISPYTTPLGDERSGQHPSGGRIADIAVSASDPNIVYAGGEYSGLFRSVDGGESWTKLHQFTPQNVAAVAVHPTDPDRIVVASYYDGRTNTLSGITVSSDAGATWRRPDSVTPPDGFCLNEDMEREFWARSVTFDPINPDSVFVGTTCGLAASNDAGETWRYIIPQTFPSSTGPIVYDVFARDGIIDSCGTHGFARSRDNGVTWRSTSTFEVRGHCSLARSPDNAEIVFHHGIAGARVRESRDGGLTWPIEYGPTRYAFRTPHIHTNDRADGFDLWISKIPLQRASCRDMSGSDDIATPSCDAQEDWEFALFGGHGDLSPIIFDPRATNDACPVIHASDGGIFVETKGVSPACHSPLWREARRVARGLEMHDFSGYALDDPDAVGLATALQDNGVIFTGRGGAEDAEDHWDHTAGGDGFVVVAGEDYVFQATGPPDRLHRFRWTADFDGRQPVSPPGDIRDFSKGKLALEVRPGTVALATMNGLFLSSDMRDFTSDVTWTALPGDNPELALCGLQLSSRGDGRWTLYAYDSDTDFFSGGYYCDSDDPAALYRYDSDQADLGWRRITRSGRSDFGEYAVDPKNPDRLIAADLQSGEIEFVISEDAGESWRSISSLNTVMTAGGTFAPSTVMSWAQNNINGYLQPSLLAISPYDPEMIVAGFQSAGVYLSLDGGESWEELSNNVTPTAAQPAITRLRHAYFDGLRPGLETNLFLTGIGTGIWRANIKTDDLCDGVPSCVDLAVRDFTLTGEPKRVVDEDGVAVAHFPVQVRVVNRGTRMTEMPFKLSASFTGLTVRPDDDFAAFFETDDGSTYYPFRTMPLAPGEIWTVNADLVMRIDGVSENLTLRVEADSCAGDEFMPETCRIQEADEENNLSMRIVADRP